jgi:hypothetical protein
MFKTKGGEHECNFVTATAAMHYQLSGLRFVELPTSPLLQALPRIFGVWDPVAQTA